MQALLLYQLRITDVLYSRICESCNSFFQLYNICTSCI